MHAAWRWLIEHWKPITAAIGTLVGIAVGSVRLVEFFVGYKERKLTHETGALSQIICIYAEAAKKKAGTGKLVFSDEELRSALGKDGPRFHAVIALLMKEGRATKARLPGYWRID